MSTGIMKQNHIKDSKTKCRFRGKELLGPLYILLYGIRAISSSFMEQSLAT